MCYARGNLEEWKLTGWTEWIDLNASMVPRTSNNDDPLPLVIQTRHPASRKLEMQAIEDLKHCEFGEADDDDKAN
jgi:hypothetical protein